METTQARHTPGPWKLFDGRSSSRGEGQLVIGAFDCARQAAPRIAWVNETTPQMNQFTPDARLIAAAPDLLEALKAVFEHCEMVHNRWGEDSNLTEANAAIAAGRAAIAKATE